MESVYGEALCWLLPNFGFLFLVRRLLATSCSSRLQLDRPTEFILEPDHATGLMRELDLVANCF
jgi:hypothetical protein